MAILIMGRTGSTAREPGLFLLSFSTKFSYYKMCVLWHCYNSGLKITEKVSYSEFSRQFSHNRKLSFIWLAQKDNLILLNCLMVSIWMLDMLMEWLYNWDFKCVFQPLCYNSVGHLGKWLLQYSKKGENFSILFFFIPTGINQKGCYKAKKSFQLVSHFQFVLL